MPSIQHLTKTPTHRTAKHKADEIEEELVRIKLGRLKLRYFIEYCFEPYEHAKHHAILCEKLEEVEKYVQTGGKEGIGRLVVTMPPRHGKEIRTDFPVLTTSGWKCHGDLKKGDCVFHPSGKAIKVVSVSPVNNGDEDRCEVELTNGEIVPCHPNHEWTVYHRPSRQWKTVETQYFLAETKFGKVRKLGSGKIGRGNRYYYQLPNIHPLEMEKARLPLDPYVFGAWLGDGSTGVAAITHAQGEKEVVQEIIRRGYKMSAFSVHKDTGCITARFAGKMSEGLSNTGVRYDKGIPDMYKYSSIEQRSELIAGLVDTDGHVEQASGRVRIVTGSKGLAEDIYEVASSLGCRPYISYQEPSLSSSGIQGKKRIYTVGFQPSVYIPTRLLRKAIDGSGVRRRVAIQSVRYCKAVAGNCITVDSPDGLYLVGKSLIPTHNSLHVSWFFPAWFLGRNPDKRVMICSHGAELAEGFSGKVRNLVEGTEYQKLFGKMATRDAIPSPIALDPSTRSKQAWDIAGNYGGVFAAGVGGPITGRGADVLIIDDPLKNREEADSETVRGNIKDWFTSTAFTRLQPGGAVIIMMCMTGDTPVLMANGREKLLKDIKVGEYIATYEGGKITTAKVMNWKNQGLDLCYEIKMKSGITVTANERHPFLVERNGKQEWIRLKNLKIGDTILKATGGSGVGRSAQNATSPQNVKGCASPTITRRCGQMEKDQTHVKPEQHDCDTDMGLRSKSLRLWRKFRRGFVQSVGNLQRRTSVSTTVMKQVESGGCCATTVTCVSGTEKQKRTCCQPLDTYKIVHDTLVSITPVEDEEVFDIQVDRTENFIANGLVAHNTRWHEDDLIGWVLSEKNDDGRWDLLNLPAIAEDRDTFRQPGEALWPTRFPVHYLEENYKYLLPPRDWNAMYQQRPTSEEGDVFVKDWFVYDLLPEKDEISYALQVWDCALTEKDEGDYSAGVTMFVTKAGVYVADIVRGHWNFPTLKQKMFEQYEFWSKYHRVSRVCIENRVSGQSMIQSLKKESALPIIAMEPESKLGKSKRLRAEAVAGYVQSGRVIFKKNAPWLHDFEHELLAFPHGKHDDMCLDPFTNVLTRSGWKMLFAIKVGEKVWTRDGWKRVLWSGKTGVTDKWFTIATEYGDTLEGTGSHPVFVAEKGFVRLDSIVYGDNIKVWSRNKSLMGLLLGGIQKAGINITEGIFKLIQPIRLPYFTYTGISGKNTMEQSRVEWKSITKTGIPQTTKLGIWNWLQNHGTESTMPIRSQSILPGSVRLLLVGILLKKDKNGIQNTEKPLGKIGVGILSLAQSVGLVIRRLFPLVPVIVPASVISVTSERLKEKRSVWNLKVEGCPEFLTDCGIVHNCDAFVYGLIQVQGGGRATRSTVLKQKQKMLRTHGRMDRLSALAGGF